MKSTGLIRQSYVKIPKVRADKRMNQPTLFETETENVGLERLTLYALGEFQARGKALAERELALDRLRGAFKRASEHFQIAELADEKIAETLGKLGAKVVKVPSFVAKHPFRVTVHAGLAARAFEFYLETIAPKAEA
jgi:histone H3/H4